MKIKLRLIGNKKIGYQVLIRYFKNGKEDHGILCGKKWNAFTGQELRMLWQLMTKKFGKRWAERLGKTMLKAKR